MSEIVLTNHHLKLLSGKLEFVNNPVTEMNDWYLTDNACDRGVVIIIYAV